MTMDGREEKFESSEAWSVEDVNVALGRSNISTQHGSVAPGSPETSTLV